MSAQSVMLYTTLKAIKNMINTLLHCLDGSEQAAGLAGLWDMRP